MKKILSLLLAITMTAALSTVVFAEEIGAENNVTLDIDKAAVSPVIDGKLDADSYKKIDFTAGDFSYNGTDQMDYIQTLPLEAHISYDDSNIYLLLSGDASKYYYCDHTEASAGDIWNQSCIQASFALENASGEDRLEIGLARNSSTGEILTQIWAQSTDGKNELELVEGQNFAIILDGGKLNYEMKIPFETFMMSNPKAGDKIGFNFIYGWSDQGSREIVEYSSGCAYSGKNSDLFAKATLTSNILQAAAPVVETKDEPAEETPEMVEEAPAETNPEPVPVAPATGDMTIILVVLCAAAGLGVCISLRKKSAIR